MKKRKSRIFMGDFETTVYDGQDDTQVWAVGLCELYTENVVVLHRISEMFLYFLDLRSNIICYFHNLKFDGEFIIWYLLHELKFKQAYDITYDDQGNPTYHWQKQKNMKHNTFKYSISNKGAWYTIIVNYKGWFFEFRDSLKLLPFSVKKIGKDFKTKHQKTSMEYKGLRYPGCEIKPEEQEYIGNDVMVTKEALEFMFDEGHTELTIGSCCLKEFKQIFKKENWETYEEAFPNLFKVKSKSQYVDTVGDFILKTYKGAICLLVKGKEGKIFQNGYTFDVNSLYPYVMHSDSGFYYAVGQGYYFTGQPPKIAYENHHYYYIHIRTRFYLKEGYLPYIQIKGNKLYKSTEHLFTSDVYDYEDESYKAFYTDREGNVRPAIVDLYITMYDWEIIQEHYHLVETEYIEGYWFYTRKGIFDTYIDKYKEIKMNSTGAVRETAKLYSNNLYGKEASNTNSSFKVIDLKDDGSLCFQIQEEYEKEPGYIPIGSAITSHARYYIMKIAQANYHGVDKPGFIYCDTDSIHLDCRLKDVVGIEEHPTIYGKFKCEATWDEAIFTRQKTYIERVVEENHKPVKKPYYNVKCAGMPQPCKDYFIQSIIKSQDEVEPDYYEWKRHYDEAELKFFFDWRTKRWRYRDLNHFNLGLSIPGKLFPKHIKGGVLLVEGPYTMR